jgi:hypothetical protein
MKTRALLIVVSWMITTPARSPQAPPVRLAIGGQAQMVRTCR